MPEREKKRSATGRKSSEYASKEQRQKANAKGTAHETSSEEARKAGSKAAPPKKEDVRESRP